MKRKYAGYLAMSLLLLFAAAFPSLVSAAEVPTLEVSFGQDWYEAGEIVTADVVVRNAEFNTAGFSLEYDKVTMTAVTETGGESVEASELIAVKNQYNQSEDTGYFSVLSRKADIQKGRLSAALYVNPLSSSKTVDADKDGIQIASLHFKMLKDGKPGITFTKLEEDADFSERDYFVMNNGEQPEGASAMVVFLTSGAGVLTGIEVDPPDKTVYKVGDKLDTKGMSVTACYESGRKKTVTDYSLSTFDSSAPGVKTIKVTYRNMTGEFLVTVEKQADKPQWIQDSKGWWYRYGDGTYPKACWKLIDGKWYYFNEEGYRKSGWILDGKVWYYCNADGIMQTGWLLEGKTWYYLKGNGAMATDWIQLGNTWYYLKSNGAMATDWLKLGNTWYYLKSSGAMATGWLKLGNTWYYLKSSGAMVTGWLKLGNTWYYLESSGAMATGWIKLGNTWYYLKSSGAMASNTWVGKYYVNSSGAWTKTR